MDIIPLGLITVATAGTPVAITSASTKLPPSGQVAKIEVWPNPAAAGKVYVKSAGTILATLPVASAGAVVPWATPESDENNQTPGKFSLDAATNGDGAFVSLWVK